MTFVTVFLIKLVCSSKMNSLKLSSSPIIMGLIPCDNRNFLDQECTLQIAILKQAYIHSVAIFHDFGGLANNK